MAKLKQLRANNGSSSSSSRREHDDQRDNRDRRDSRDHRDHRRNNRDHRSHRNAADTTPRVQQLTDQEKQERLDEMQQNAAWRAKQRETTLFKHRRDQKLAAEDDYRNNDTDNQQKASNMFNNIMRDAYCSTEDRIKRNIKNVQRSESSNDKKFTER